jgi:hypothetical protein
MFSTISGNLFLARSKPRDTNYTGFWHSFGTARFENCRAEPPRETQPLRRCLKGLHVEFHAVMSPSAIAPEPSNRTRSFSSPTPDSTPTNAASEGATSTIEELPLDRHVTRSAVRERICAHRTFTLGSTDSPGFNKPPTLNSRPRGRSKSIRTGTRCTTFT